MTPLISIIIPTYNRAHLIGETLDSIIDQTYTNWECIVVDDGSTDNTAAVVAKYIEKDKRFQFYKRPENKKKGPNSCRNYGFEKSKGEYINWFDSDDIMLPFFLEKQIDSIGKNADISVCKLTYFDFDNGIGIKENKIITKNLIEDYLIGKLKFYTFTPVWRKKFLEQQDELFDESITNLDDWDFNLRMLYQEPSITYLNESLILYRVHEASLSHEISKLNFKEVNSEFRAIKKHLQLIEINKKANPVILKIYLKERCRLILRLALVNNNKHKYYYFKQLLIVNFQLFRFLEMMKTIIGFTIYSIFKKGYKLL